MMTHCFIIKLIFSNRHVYIMIPIATCRNSFSMKQYYVIEIQSSQYYILKKNVKRPLSHKTTLL